MRIRINPLWPWKLEETSLDIQNKGTSGPKKGLVYVSDKATITKHIRFGVEIPQLTLPY